MFPSTETYNAHNRPATNTKFYNSFPLASSPYFFSPTVFVSCYRFSIEFDASYCWESGTTGKTLPTLAPIITISVRNCYTTGTSQEPAQALHTGETGLLSKPPLTSGMNIVKIQTLLSHTFTHTHTHTHTHRALIFLPAIKRLSTSRIEIDRQLFHFA